MAPKIKAKRFLPSQKSNFYSQSNQETYKWKEQTATSIKLQLKHKKQPNSMLKLHDKTTTPTLSTKGSRRADLSKKSASSNRGTRNRQNHQEQMAYKICKKRNKLQLWIPNQEKKGQLWYGIRFDS